MGAAVLLLLLGIVLSACGSTPVAQNWPGLTLADDTLYVISGTPQRVYMLDAETGMQKGTYMPPIEDPGTVWWSPVTVEGDLAFAGFAESQAAAAALFAFEPASGQTLWNIPAEGLIVPAPVYADGVVYFGSDEGKLYAVSVETRSIRPGWPFQTDSAIWASPLVVNGRVYLPSMDHYLYCLDADTGELLWKTQLGGAMAASPTLDAETGILYVGAFDGKVYAVDAETGDVVRGFDFQAENWIWSKPLLADGQLFVTSLDGKLYALDPASGAVISPYPYNSADLSGKDDTVRADPIQVGERVVVAAQSGRVIAVQNAQQQWYWPSGTPNAEILTTPVLGEGIVYSVLMNGQVQSLDAETGVPGWTFTPPEGE
jgi:outer membrane protein assembly factor BamB